MAVTVIKDLAHAAAMLRAAPVTIGELANGPGLVYRHPDSAQISYPLTVQNALGSVPGGQTSVAIIGAGPAGIAALYELRQIANANPGRRIEAVIFETDPANFMFPSPPPQYVTPRRAGRVSSYFTPQTVYEIGAMRFPSIAGLTWHYAERAFGAATVVNPFPNPGTVPTEFVFGSRFDRYFGAQWLDPNSPTRTVRDLVIEGLVGTGPNPPYKIGPYTPAQVIALLVNPNTPQATLAQIQAYWGLFIKANDGTTLEAAVRLILTTAQQNGRLPLITGLTGDQLLDWCVELFGRFGFGTGGFKSLYNISLVEMMRLVLWDYSNEYTFPPNLAPGNVDFIAKLRDIAAEPPVANFRMASVHARVSDVFHRAEPRAACVAYYEADDPVKFATFDYAILALPHDAATTMVNRLGYSPEPLNDPEIGDVGKSARPGFDVLPGLLLSTQPVQDTVNARAVTAVSMLHMTRSSKIFATITDAAAKADPVPQFQGSPISAVVSDCGLAATYLVPSPTNPNYRSFLVTYTWDDDSTKLEHNFAEWPQNISPPGPASMFDAMLNRTYRQNPATPDTNSKWWLYTVLTKAEPVDRVCWDWSTYLTAGGFKLDMTGDHNQSDLCFRYHTHALYNNPRFAPAERLDSRVFLASCSFSHLGGWLEGAFMSAVNAVAGIVVSINQGDVGALNPEARKLLTTLKPVIPMN
jgi:phenylalanine 2-monooxygenase